MVDLMPWGAKLRPCWQLVEAGWQPLEAGHWMGWHWTLGLIGCQAGEAKNKTKWQKNLQNKRQKEDQKSPSTYSGNGTVVADIELCHVDVGGEGLRHLCWLREKCNPVEIA